MKKGAMSGPRNISRQALEVAGVARDKFVRLRLDRNQGVPIVIHPRSLDTQLLGLVQAGQHFILGQLHKFKSARKFSQPGRAFVLGKNHPVGMSDPVGNLHAPSRHGGEEFRQKVQAGHMFSTVQPSIDFRRKGGIDRRGCVPIRSHERLSRSSATAWPMASGESLYPVGT